MVILYFLRWFNIILFLRFLFQPGRLCTKLGFFVYYYLPYCYLHQTQENENGRSIKEGKIILKIALRLWSYVLDFLFSNPIVWSYIFRRIFFWNGAALYVEKGKGDTPKACGKRNKGKKEKEKKERKKKKENYQNTI